MRGKSLFPIISIEDAQQIAIVIAQKNSGQAMRRLAAFEELGKSPDSGPSRSLVTASSGYGLTTGGYQAEYLDLTDLGRRLAVDADESALIDGVMQVDIFKKFFQTYKNSQIPSLVAAKSFLADSGIPADRAEPCLHVLLDPGRYTGRSTTLSGSERVLTRDHALEIKGGTAGQAPKSQPTAVPKTPPKERTS